MTTRKPKILRAPRHGKRPADVDEANWNVILHVRPTAETIRLNVEITATEGENGYVYLLKENKSHKLKEPSSDQTPSEWQSVLRAVLLSDPDDSDLHWLPRLSYFANVKTSSVEFAILEDVDGIKRRLGTVIIPTGDVEVELWSWLGGACLEKDDATRELRTAQLEVKRLAEENEALSRQIEEFIKSKEEGEKMMVKRFTELLNEKKRKLRSVMRSSNRTTLDTGKKSDDGDDDGGDDEKEKERRAQLKRKASKTAEELEDEENTDGDDFAGKGTAGSSDQVKPSTSHLQSDSDVSMTGRHTPDRDSDETTDDDGDIPPSPPAAKRTVVAKGKARGTSKSKSVSPPRTRAQDSKKDDEDEEMEEEEESNTLEGDGEDDDGDDEL